MPFKRTTEWKLMKYLDLDMEHEGDGDGETYNNCHAKSSLQQLGKENGGIRIQRKNRKLPNQNIFTIG